MKSSVVINLILFIVFVSFQECVSEMRCGNGNSIIDSLKGPTSCPQSEDLDNAFCCESDMGFRYCCSAGEFVGRNGIGIVIPVVISLIVGFLVVCCLCCLCCPCCMLYKRRHNGTVYGRVQQTTVVAVPQPVNQYPNQAAPPYLVNPTMMPQPAPAPMMMPNTVAMPQPGFGYSNQAGYPESSGVQPPPYSIATINEGYAKQAPFNPNY